MMAQRMRRDRFGNVRPSASPVTFALDRTAADRGARPSPGEEPVRGPVDLPPRAQDLEERRGEHHIAIPLPLALRDAEDHPVAIDGGHKLKLPVPGSRMREQRGGRPGMGFGLTVGLRKLPEDLGEGFYVGGGERHELSGRKEVFELHQ